MAADFMPNTLHINTALGQVETCDYDVEDRHGVKSYAVGDPVTIKEGTVTIFQGDIDEISVRSLDSPYSVKVGGQDFGAPVGARIWSIKAVGGTHLAGRKLTGWVVFYPGTSMAIAATYFADLIGVGISTTIGSLQFENEFICDYELVRDALDRLADLVTAASGLPLYWRVSSSSGSSVLEFGLSSGGGGLIGLNPGGYPVKAGATRVSTSREQFSNLVVLKLDKQIVDTKETIETIRTNAQGEITSDDIQTEDFSTLNEEFQIDAFFPGHFVKLAYPVAGAPTVEIQYVNPDVERPEPVPVFSVGVKGVVGDAGKDFLFNTGSPIISQGANLSFTTYDGDIYRILYMPLDIRVISVYSGAGDFQTVIQQGDSGNSSSPDSQARAELYRHNKLVTTVRTTLRFPAGTYVVGSTVGVYLRRFDTYGPFYIRSMREYDEDGILIWRELELVNGPMIYSASQFMRRLTR